MVSTFCSSVPFSSCVLSSLIDGTSDALSWSTREYEFSKKVAILAKLAVAATAGGLSRVAAADAVSYVRRAMSGSV